MNQDAPPPGKGDFHKIFIKAKGESTWTEVDAKHLSTLIDQRKKVNKSNEHQVPITPSTYESEHTTIPGTTDTNEILDILILVDINVPTPTVSLLPPALVTFVAYKLYGQENHVCARTCAFIKELMSSYCFTAVDAPTFNELKIDSDFDKDFYTAFIGTLFDDDYSSLEVVYNKEANLVHKTLENLESCVNCSVQGMPLSFWYLETGSYVQIVNLLSTENKIFENLRDKLKRLVEQNPVFEIPLNWVLLSMKVQMLCIERNAQSSEQHKLQYMHYGDVKTIWYTECKESSESELLLALQFFHHNGILFHFDAVGGARDYVFTDCRWMFDQLKCLLSGVKGEGVNHNAKELLTKEGILKYKMLKHIEFNGPERMTLQTFLKLLIYLNFIAEVNTNDGRMYFMPSILESYGSDEKIFDRYGNKSHDSLQITFSSGSLHRSVFCLLSAYILNNMPKGWKKLGYDKQTQTQHTFKDLITFSIEGGSYVCFIDKIFSLEISVYSKSQSCSQELHLNIYGIIQEALKCVCQTVGIPYTECKYGFTCSKCGSDNHMMTLEDQASNSARCSKYNDSQPLSDGQSVWLKVRI